MKPSWNLSIPSESKPSSNRIRRSLAQVPSNRSLVLEPRNRSLVLEPRNRNLELALVPNIHSLVPVPNNRSLEPVPLRSNLVLELHIRNLELARRSYRGLHVNEKASLAEESHKKELAHSKLELVHKKRLEQHNFRHANAASPKDRHHRRNRLAIEA